MSNTQVQPAQPTGIGALLKQPSSREMLRKLLVLSNDERGDRQLDRYIAVCFQTIVRNPMLMKCDPMSLFLALKDAATLRLDIDGVLGQAYVVPYGGKAQMQLGYRGVIALSLRSGTVEHVDADVVWVWDRFVLTKGSRPSIEVEPQPPPAGADLTDIESITGAYAVAHLRGGGTKMEWVWLADILRSREHSQAYRNALKYNRNDSPWQQHPARMAAKTAVHRLGKQLELSPEDMRALIRDEMLQEGKVIEAQALRVATGPDVDLEALLSQGSPAEESIGPSGAGAEAREAKDPKGGGKLDAPASKGRAAARDTKEEMFPEEGSEDRG